jgi:Domain of unknown function (DUF5076)
MAGPKEQPLPPDVMGRDDATEVLRAFVVDGGLSIAFTRAFEERATPPVPMRAKVTTPRMRR